LPHETTTKVLYNINKRFVDGEMQRKSSEESPAEDVLSPTGQSKTSPYIQRNSRVLARHQARMAAKRNREKEKRLEEIADIDGPASGVASVDKYSKDGGSVCATPMPPQVSSPAPPPPPSVLPQATAVPLNHSLIGSAEHTQRGIIRQISGNSISPPTPLEEDVTTFLSKLNLGQYSTRFEAEGYDDMDIIRGMTPSQFESMAEDIKMKRGHQLKLRKALEVDGANSTTQHPATPTTPSNKQSFSVTPETRLHQAEKSPTNQSATKKSHSPVVYTAEHGGGGGDGVGDTPRGNWKQGEVIGRGAFGQVFKGLWTGRGVVIAIKELYFDKEQKKQLRLLRKEIEMLRRMKHDNIVTYLGGEEQLDGDSSKLYIFCEWVAGGSVQGMLDRYGKFDEGMCKRYATGALQGLRYLHEYLGTPVIHRDIKPANVLVTPDGVAKLADFGAAHFLDNSLGQTAGGGSSLAGTPYFMAPETIDQRNVGRRSDVWSFGGFVLNMVTGRPPWKLLDLRSPWALFEHVRSSEETPLDVEVRLGGRDLHGGAEEVDSGFSAELTVFLQRCFTRNYNERPYARDISEDLWIKSLVTPPLGRASGETIVGIEACLKESTFLHRSTSEDHPEPSLENRKASPRDEAPPSNARPGSGPSLGTVRSSPSKSNNRGFAALQRRASKASASPTTPGSSTASASSPSPQNGPRVSPAVAAAARRTTSSTTSTPPARANPFSSRQRAISNESRTNSSETPGTPEASSEVFKSSTPSSGRLSEGSPGNDEGANDAVSILRRASGGDAGVKTAASRTRPPGGKFRLSYTSSEESSRLGAKVRQKMKEKLAPVPGPSASPSKVPSPRPAISLETVTAVARDPGASLTAGDLDRQHILGSAARQDNESGNRRAVESGISVQTIDLDAERFCNSQRAPGAWNRESLAKAAAAEEPVPGGSNDL
jgi:serine/threonine protein kinase